MPLSDVSAVKHSVSFIVLRIILSTINYNDILFFLLCVNKSLNYFKISFFLYFICICIDCFCLMYEKELHLLMLHSGVFRFFLDFFIFANRNIYVLNNHNGKFIHFIKCAR